MKSGFVSRVGLPNAGKSTLLNRLVGEKLAIVSDKPQTTRNRIRGVRNYETGQVVYVDTPGIHKPTHRMNVRMVDAALESMRDVDLVGVVLDASQKPGGGQQHLFGLVKSFVVPVVLIMNKIDLVGKAKLLPIIDRAIKELEGLIEQGQRRSPPSPGRSSDRTPPRCAAARASGTRASGRGSRSPS